MSIASPIEVEVPVLASSKKQRSARTSGKKGWTPAVPEIRRLVGCSYSTNDGFSPHTLVWAKRNGGPWWPARVVSVEEIPEDLKKQEEGWTCVKYYGVDGTEAFACLKAEDLSAYEKHSEEFTQQNIPHHFNLDDFKAALVEVQEVADRRSINAVTKFSSGNAKPQESKSLLHASSSHKDEEDDVKDAAQIADVIEQPLKRRKLKFKGVDRRPATDDNLSLVSKAKEASKELKALDKTPEMKGKRKRMLRQQVESDGDVIPTGDSLESPIKKIGSSTGNSSSLSSRDHVKKSRGKKTGADGYYFECMVCDMGGDLLCCDLCPRVYHLECLIPPLKRTPPGKWICPVCRDTPGAVKSVGGQTPESKPRFKTTNDNKGSALAPTPKMRPGPKRGWKLFHRGKQLTQDLDLRKLRKRKREEDMERPRKRLNLKISRTFSSQTQPKCRQCGAGINSSGESSSNVFCKDCVELVKQRNLNSTGKAPLPLKDMIPTRHSKLKPGKCDICNETGFVIFCDTCPRGYHKDCLNPPRKRAPKGAWTCPKCGPVKDVKEGKDAREAREGREGREGRDAAKEVKAVKTVKSTVKVAKVVKEAQKSKEDKQEQTTATPAPLDVDRILGCRISHLTSSKVHSLNHDFPKDGKDLALAEDVVLKSKPGKSTAGTKLEKGNAIEIRLPICQANQSTGERDVHGQLEPDVATNTPTPSLPTETESHSSSDVRSRSTGPVASGGDSLGADQSSIVKLMELDLEMGILNEAPSQLDDSSIETEIRAERNIVEGVSSCMNDQERNIMKVGVERSVLDGSGRKEGNKLVVAAFTTGKPVLKFKDMSHIETTGSTGDVKMQDIESSDTRKVGLAPASLSIAKAADKDIPVLSLDSAVPLHELEFYVKWAGRAHIHNEWVTEEVLRGIAKRKLENFKLKHRSVPLMLMEEQWVKPQRIVAKRTVHGKVDEVLVKWCGLSYEECTWEFVDHPVIVSKSQLIRTFDVVEQEAVGLDADLLDKGANIIDPFCLRGQRPTEIETIKEQPPYLKGGSLFPHQMEAINWLRKCWQRQRNVILADEMGLGKTISACSFIASLRHEFQVRAPCLVLVPLSTMPNWLAEFALWAPSLNVIEYHGSAKARAMIREYEWHGVALDGTSKKTKHSFKFNVMLTTYEMVIADSSQLRAVPWEVLVVDEGHRLKNSGSKLFTLLNTFSFSHRVLLTGTPLQNNFGEMFNLLNFLQPDTFPSLAAFQDKFSTLSTADQVEELKKLVAPNMLRRLKKDAMQKIPPKTELVVPVDMNSVQIEYYKALLTRNYQVLRNGGKQQSMLNIVMQLRKVCNHPYLITGTEPGTGTPEFLQEMRIKASAKLTLLHSMLGKLKADGHRVLIFSQMTKLLDILEDYLTFEFGQEAFERVDGSVSVSERQTAIARFNQDTSRFVFLLSTRACGLGINLATADTVIIYDSDFNPQADIQAMNRAHRIGQSKTLLVYRLVVRASVEERILQLAKKKLMLDHLFANKSGSQKEVDDILRWGTEELFQETSNQTDEPGCVSSVPSVVDDVDTKLKKKGGELGDMYGGYYLQLGRSKVVWDDAAVKRLLDRSDLSNSHPEATDGEQESDILGSLKAWDWNEQDVVPEEQDGDEALEKESDVEKQPKTSAAEEENQWDKLLRSRWETLQTEEEAALGRGKRNRKVVSYIESNGQKSKEPLSEHSSDADKEEDPEPDYTPVGRALKQKLAKLRARQKDRILQRCNEAAGIVDGKNLVMMTGVLTEGMGVLKKFDGTREENLWSLLPSLPAGGDTTDLFLKADLNGNVHSPTSSLGLGNISISTEHPFQTRSTSPSFLAGNVEWHLKSNPPYVQQVHPVPSLPSLIDEGGAAFKASGNDHGQAMWLGGVPSVTGSSSVMSQIFGRPVAPGVESRVEGISTISLSVVSQELESGQSLSRLIPALRQSLQGPKYGNPLQPAAPVQVDLRGPTPPAPEVPPNPSNQSSQQDSGLGAFPSLRSANSSKPAFNLDDIKSLTGHQYKSKPPDAALEFSQRLFGTEKTLHTGAMLSTGEDSAGQQSKYGSLLPSALLTGEEMSCLKLQRSEHIPGLGTSLQPSTQGARIPNLSIALGLQFAESSPTAEARTFQDTRTSIAAAPSGALSSGFYTKGMDLHGVGGSSHGSGNYHKLGTKDMMPIELHDDDPEPLVSTRRFLSPGTGDSVGRVWHSEDHRKPKDQGTRAWTEDELDALWTGVRRHGRGNWAEMLHDSKLCFLKSRSVGELAKRWKEEQMKLFGIPKQSTSGRQTPSVWSEASPEQVFLRTSGIECGRTSNSSVLLTSNCNSESAVVHADDKFFQKAILQEKESLPWVISDVDTKPSKDKIPHFTSSAGGPSTLSGLQLVDKIGELGRFEPNRQGFNYHNLLDLQSGRSSPSIPTSLPGRSSSTAPTNVGSFGPSSQVLSRLDRSIFKTAGTLEQTSGEFGPGLSPGLGLGPEWRRQETKDRTSWQSQGPHLAAADSGKHQSGFSERSSTFRSQDPHANLQIPPAPSPRLGSPAGLSVGSKVLVSLPHNGGPVSTAEHRRRARAGPSAKASSSINADDSTPSNLPHWLREAVKARSAPPQPPLPPAIAAVVQATNLLYKNSKRLLPPLVHPGYPMVPPREFPKKPERRRRRPKVNQQPPPSSRTEILLVGNPSVGLDFSRPIKVEGLNQPLLPLPPVEGASAVLSRSLPALGQANSSLPRSKGFPDFPMLPSLDHPQQQISHIPVGSLSELMARKSLMELGFIPGFSDPSQMNPFNRNNPLLDESITLPTSLGQGRRPPLDLRPESDLQWKRSEMQQESLLPPSVSLPSQRHFPRSSQGVVFSEAFLASQIGEENFLDPEKKSQLPQWLLSGDVATKSDGRQKHRQKDDVEQDDDNESTSSKTVSDPGIHSKCGKDDDNSDDASSEETISDDGTQ